MSWAQTNKPTSNKQASTWSLKKDKINQETIQFLRNVKEYKKKLKIEGKSMLNHKLMNAVEAQLFWYEKKNSTQ